MVERRELLDASPWLKVFAETVRLEDGNTLVPNFYHIESPSFVMIFAITADHQVAVIEHYRHAIGRYVFDLPAGYIESGEEPLISAKRELLEETGLDAPDWKPLGVFTIDGNRGCGQCHAFFASNARHIATPNAGDLELQTLHFFEISHLRQRWLDGDFPTISSAAIIGLGLAHAEQYLR